MKQKTKTWFRKNLFSLITITLSMAVMGYFLVKDNGLKNLWDSLLDLRPGWLFCVMAGVVAGWVLEGYVLHLFCRHLYHHWTFGRSFYVGMVGLLYSNLTPFSVGEPMEIYNMTRIGMDVGAATSIVAVKSLVHHAVTFFYSLLLVALKLHYFQTAITNFSFVTVFGLATNCIFIVGVFLMIENSRLTEKILETIVRVMNRMKMQKLAEKFYKKAHSHLLIFHDSADIMGRSFPLYFTAVMLTVAQVTISSLVSYFVYRSFNLKGQSVLTLIAGDAFTTMAASFVPLPGSSGGMEGGFVLFFHSFFGNRIMPAVTLWRTATYYIEIPIGALISSLGSKKYTVQNTDLS
ncbi:MAG TPA: lysylphosphatidylglycerol synthetase family protein [Ruminococcaceae bacterium]|jgi:hypothetical protein|nr:lysylphosphatidylglycerol synthetase family protein [Oscillospiraceae bacterium]HBG55332.1 lysylphosphatidylglycerol synthetase family protein [Oscillospiraceae bacterium]HBQ47192.1 lysylphosphatidylglycerol synthetase family protein [Oscillospiraceae bacterium]HBT91314.1 lysylphosphatidylglycerol synthetase family protein [Oscillospiraceae bacterium]HCB90410.1 lysylphosphatidylglycerol synthetase family protein [Oscillospiraceae bacterium]